MTAQRLSSLRRFLATMHMGKWILGLGVAGVLLLLVLDLVGIGKPGFQAAQILGLEVAGLAILLGVGMHKRPAGQTAEGDVAAEGPAQGASNPGSIRWVLLGFMAVFISLFLQHMFWNSERRIRYFHSYVPDQAPIGSDLNWNTANIRGWLAGKGMDVGGVHYYPPLHAVLFAPIVLLRYPTDYYLMTSLTVASLAALSLLLPYLLGIRGREGLAVFFFLTGIVSYGMQFELERGQFNVVTYLLALLGIYVFHSWPSFRALALALFSAAVQLKIYPSLLILALVDNRSSLKVNLLRLLGLGALNAAFLFALGPAAFGSFVNAVSSMAARRWGLPDQHSIRGFLSMLAARQPEILSEPAAARLGNNIGAYELVLYTIVAVCLGLLVVRAIKRGERGVNLDLLAVATLAAIVLPSISYDYTLALVGPALGLCLAARPMPATTARAVGQAALTSLAAAGYTVLLFPYSYRPLLLWNSCLPLLLILAVLTALSMLDGGAVVRVPTNQRLVSQTT